MWPLRYSPEKGLKASGRSKPMCTNIVCSIPTIGVREKKNHNKGKWKIQLIFNLIKFNYCDVCFLLVLVALPLPISSIVCCFFFKHWVIAWENESGCWVGNAFFRFVSRQNNGNKKIKKYERTTRRKLELRRNVITFCARISCKQLCFFYRKGVGGGRESFFWTAFF